MKIVMMVVGTTGDFVPYTGAAARLRDAGHDVVFAAEDSFGPALREFGFETRSFHFDIREMLSGSPVHGQRQDHNKAQNLKAYLDLIRHGNDRIFRSCETMIAAAEGAELLMVNFAGSMQGYLIAKAMGIPSMGMYAFPVTVTGEYPPPLPPVLFNGASLGPVGNRMARLIGLYGASLFTNWSTKLQQRLGLPTTSLAQLDREMTETGWPIRYGYSEAVSPRPKDWPDHVEIVGYWWPEPRNSWQPSSELVDFLADGPPPVFVTSGSFGKDDDGRMSQIFVEALRKAGVRGVIQTGWVGLRGATDDTVLTIGEVDYGWLLPRTAVVVHRAGAGTTAAALRAKVPAIPVPVSLDNFHWARRLVAIGASPGMVPARSVAVDRLAHLITRAVRNPAFRDRAAGVSALLEREDGAGRVAAEVDRLATVRRT